MNGLLESIVATNAVSTTNQRQAALVNEGLKRFGDQLPFRGLLNDVRGTEGVELQRRAQLDWKTITRPVLVEGKAENRKALGYQALIRSDNGGLLSITSDKFKAHQNYEILADISEIARVGDADIVYAGPLDDGKRVAVVARLNGQFELPGKLNHHAGNVEGADTTHLFVVISGGHEVGTPLKVRGLAFRLWCLNGAYFTRQSSSTLVITHRSEIKAAVERIRATYASIGNEFRVYGDNAAKLQAERINKDQERLYVAELLRPGLAQIVSERIQNGFAGTDVWQEVAQSERGRRALDQVIAESDALPGFQRTGKQLLDSIVNQTGRTEEQTLWNAYNGITYHVDHVRGRNAQSGVDAALFGAGATLKEKALQTALGFAR